MTLECIVRLYPHEWHGLELWPWLNLPACQSAMMHVHFLIRSHQTNRYGTSCIFRELNWFMYNKEVTYQTASSMQAYKNCEIKKMVQWNGECSLGSGPSWHSMTGWIKSVLTWPLHTQDLQLHGSGNEALSRRKQRAVRKLAKWRNQSLNIIHLLTHFVLIEL